MVCEAQKAKKYSIFLPTRDRKFIGFATKTIARASVAGFSDFTLLKMDTHFSDYEDGDKLCSLMGINP